MCSAAWGIACKGCGLLSHMAAIAFVMSTYTADASFKQRVLSAFILGLVVKPFKSS